MKKLKQVVSYFTDNLVSHYPSVEIDAMAFWTIESCLNLSRSAFKLEEDRVLLPDEVSIIKNVVSRLTKNEPIQYIFGETIFYGLSFLVNESCLIPRPETEELVSWILEEPKASVLDIGTGSGCIAISIAKKTKASVFGLDISEKALALAKKNAKMNHVFVQFNQVNILDLEKFEKVDIIVSNPPYVLESDKKMMDKNVLEYEPHNALFVSDNNALIFYEKIVEIAKKSLNKNGFIYFEIHESKANEIIDLLSNNNFSNIELRKDLQNKDRMVKAQFV
jgi:release factor glutamine methyltransferase